MKTNNHARICLLLQQALMLLDEDREQFAAIHVSHALETLNCPAEQGHDQIIVSTK